MPDPLSHHSATVTDEVMAKTNLTRSQMMLWVGQKLNPGVPLYNMVMSFTINGAVDARVFQQAFAGVVAASDAMRSVIEEDGGVPRQRVLETAPQPLQVLDFSGRPDPLASYQQWRDEHQAQALDIAACLYHTALIKVAEDQYVWYLNQHHLITDGWSVAQVFAQVAARYAELAAEGETDVPSLPPFQDYATYERGMGETQLGPKAGHHWQNKKLTAAESLRFYGRRTHTRATHNHRHYVDLGASRSEQLRALVQEPGLRALTTDVALFNLFATLLYAFLHRISEATELTVGTLVHNRTSDAFRSTIGAFFEVFPMHVAIDPADTFVSLHKRVIREVYDFMRHARPGTSNPDHSHAYRVLLNFINASFTDFNGVPMQSRWEHPGHVDSNHSLRLQIHDFDATGQYTLLFDFNDAVFPEAQQERAIGHFLCLMDAFIADRDQPVQRVDLMTPDEHAQMVVAFNDTATETLDALSIVERFEQQVAQQPEAVAVVGKDQRLSYRALNARANRLAHYLTRHGVGPGRPVGLCMDRTAETIVAILGILKAGGAYVPLDPAYPKQRLAYILQDAQINLLLTQSNLEEAIPPFGGTVLCLDTEASAIEQEPDHNPDVGFGGDNLAYVIYTSGSTGQPKGVLVEHQQVVHLVEGLHQRIYQRYDAGRNVALVAPLVFDASVQQIFAALLGGHALFVVPEADRLDGRRLWTYLQTHHIHISDGTPAHLKLLAASMGHAPAAPHLKHLIIGGEALHRQTLAAFWEQLQGAKPVVTNIYGTAECCVDSLAFEAEAGALGDDETVPIGTPLAHTQVYLLNEDHAPVPMGLTGEICIGGKGVGRGYLGLPALTAERFVDNPFAPGTRLYRTGDLGRFRADGTIEYAGRRDNQVKIRAHRIELGEVEAALKTFRKEEPLHLEPLSAHTAPQRCRRCLLTAAHPDVTFDADGVCDRCRSFEAYQGHADRYFQPFEAFQQLIAQARTQRQGDYDCLLLYSGGKDSSYVLHRLVEMGLKVLAYTFDNGFISPAAFKNIERQTTRLGVDSIVSRTPHMDEIFVESLNNDHTVCTGCFRALTAISTNLLEEYGINVVITGLSRGQIYDTKLAGLFEEGIVDTAEVEEKLLLFRQMYHATDDRTARLLDIDLGGVAFEDIHFVDFFRYDAISTEGVRAYLGARDSYWRQPEDTGFCSTNCMMNDVGICVHSHDKGYHNYEAPLSWDIRLGNLSRPDGLQEVTADLKVNRVTRILKKIGYFARQIDDVAVMVREDEDGHRYMCAYFVANQKLTVPELRAHLAQTLPDYMIPAQFIQLERMPLTTNGKIDRAALPRPSTERPELTITYEAPRNDAERQLAGFWQDVLGVETVGIHDNFFELGGDSIRAIQICARAHEVGLGLAPNQLFQHQTVAALAQAAVQKPTIQAEQGVVTGAVPLTPIQHWFFEEVTQTPHHWNQAWHFDVAVSLDPALLEEAVQHLQRHHDALRLRFQRDDAGWQQHIGAPEETSVVEMFDLVHLSPAEQDKEITATEADWHTRFNLATGPLLRVLYFRLGATRADRLVVVVHHLVMDGVSWNILMDDLATAYQQVARGEAVALPKKTTSYQQWATALQTLARSSTLVQSAGRWKDAGAGSLPFDKHPATVPLEATVQSLTITLAENETERLLRDVPQRYQARVHEVLLGGLALAAQAWSPGQPLRVMVEGHGREAIDAHLDVSRTVGLFTAVYPLTLPATTEAGEAIHEVKQTFQRLPYRGVGYGVLRYLSKDASVGNTLARRPVPQVLFNYLGQLDQLFSASALFQARGPLTLSRSASASQLYPVEINAWVQEGTLHINWSYSTAQFEAATVHDMAEALMQALRRLLNAKSAGDGDGAPASLVNLGTQQMDRLAALLRNADEAARRS